MVGGVEEKMNRGIDYNAIAVLCFCATEDGLWIVHKRGKKCKTPDVWGFMSGKLELGEQPQDCVIREVQEEYGCAPIQIASLEPRMGFLEHGGTTHNWLMLPYFVRVNSGDIRPNKREVAEMAFLDTFEEIQEPRHPGLMPMLDYHREELEKLLRYRG